MSEKENETAAIFKAVVDIYQSDFELYRPCRSNKESFYISNRYFILSAASKAR